MKTRMFVLFGLLLSLGLAHAGPDPVAPMQEWPGSGSIPAAGDNSRLTVDRGGIEVRVETTGLDPLAPYSVWAFIVNNPKFCLSTPCSSADFPITAGHDPRTESSLIYVTGGQSDASGNGHFVGSISRRPLETGVLARALGTWGPGLLNFNRAQIHIVLRSHGQPAVPEDVLAAITSFFGGCNVNNAVQPPCGNDQLAIHLAR